MSLLQMSFSGAIMILAVMVIRAVAINKLPKKVFVLCWEMVLLRLLIPFCVPSSFSVYSLVAKSPLFAKGTTSIENVLPEMLSDTGIPQISQEVLQGQMNVAASEVLQGQSGMTLQNMLSGFLSLSPWTVIWLIGILLCGIFFTVSYFRCYREFRTSLPVKNEAAHKWLETHTLRRPLQIRQSDRISAPLTYGIFRPVILMPKGTDWENTQQLQYILLHEYVHICRFDMVAKLITVLALCIHWFNPLVWILYLLFNRDIELSCDESVVHRFGENTRASYARTLIAMEEKKSGFMPLYNNFSKNAIEERITSIMKSKKVSVGAVVVSVVLLVTMVVVFATSAKTSAPSEEADKETEIQNIEVPHVVLEAAEQLVKQKYEIVQSSQQEEGQGKYIDWRIESLVHDYTYENWNGLTLEVYRLNYEFLAEKPEEIQLIGGMSMDEEGWVVPEYANSTYLIFEKTEGTLVYRVTLKENDCFPGDEVFTEDLARALNAEAVKHAEVEVVKRAEEIMNVKQALEHQQQELLKEEISKAKNPMEGDDWLKIIGEVEETPDRKIVYEMAKEVTATYFQEAEAVTIYGIKGLSNVQEEIGGKCTVQVEFLASGEDSLTYLSMTFEKKETGWEVSSYGLEK